MIQGSVTRHINYFNTSHSVSATWHPPPVVDKHLWQAIFVICPWTWPSSPVFSSIHKSCLVWHRQVMCCATDRAMDFAIYRSWVWVLAGHHCVVALGMLLTCVHLSPSSMIWYRPREVISLAGKVTVGLVESNGSLPGSLQRKRDQLRAQCL